MEEVVLSKGLLSVGFDRIIKASEEVTEDDLRTARIDEAVQDKLYENPLQDLMLSLVSLLETRSKESQERDTEKEKRSVTTISLSIEQENASSSRPLTPPYTQPRLPDAFETPANKRKISETSFGTRSTESTPNKLVHAEAKVQSLQSKFVDTIINKLWSGKIDMPWVQGRHMFLAYTEFFLYAT